jgi:hypothetical protein
MTNPPKKYKIFFLFILIHLRCEFKDNVGSGKIKGARLTTHGSHPGRRTQGKGYNPIFLPCVVSRESFVVYCVS